MMMVFYLSISIRSGEAGAGYPRSKERGLRCPLRPRSYQFAPLLGVSGTI